MQSVLLHENTRKTLRFHMFYLAISHWVNYIITGNIHSVDSSLFTLRVVPYVHIKLLTHTRRNKQREGSTSCNSPFYDKGAPVAQ